MFCNLIARFAFALLIPVIAAPALGQVKEWPPEYYQAHYLATEGHDPAGAAALFERVAANASLSPEQRAIVAGRLNDARERVIALQPARLCPANTIAYLEIYQPGALVERLTTMLGIETKPIPPLLAKRKPGGSIQWDHPTPTDFVPGEIAMSPALMRWLKAFDGAAAAFTGLDLPAQDAGNARHRPAPMPTGLVILNPGDADLMRGVLEMAAQFAPAAEPVGGYPAFAFPQGVAAVMTERLVIIGRPRAEVEAAVERLSGKGRDNLAASEKFASLTKGKAGATVLGFVDAQRALALAQPFLPNDDEFHMAKAMLDLDNLVGAAVGIGAIDNGLGLDASIMLNQGHHNLVYNLIRTPAMSRRSLACIPGQAAFVFGFGLNPPSGSTGISAEAKGEKLASVTGLDIFREFFGNIEEISIYVAPAESGLFSGSKGAPPAYIPNGAVIIAAGNAKKSEALWKQLLSIPSMIMGDKAAPPSEIDLAGQRVTVFALPQVGNIYLAEVSNCLVITPRKEAMTAVFRTAKSGKSIVQDDTLRPVISHLSKDVGLMMIAHIGRILQVGGPMVPAMAGGGGPPEAVVKMITGSLDKALETTVLYVGLAESETELNLRVSVAGLPNVNQLLKQVGPMARMFGGFNREPPPMARQARPLPGEAALPPRPEIERHQKSQEEPQAQPGR